MNKEQKIILAIFIPVIIFFLAFTIAHNEGTTRILHINSEQGPPDSLKYKYDGDSWIEKTHNPFDIEKTWYVWLVCLSSCCLFELLLFRNKK